MTIAALSPTQRQLVDAAWAARARGHAPFSGFLVGAAFLDEHGTVFDGANVENASYNLGLCAERVAMYHALTHGAGRFSCAAIVTEAATPTFPCGACRQALWEFAPHAELVIANREQHLCTTVAALLPHAFDASALEGGSGPISAK